MNALILVSLLLKQASSETPTVQTTTESLFSTTTQKFPNNTSSESPMAKTTTRSLISTATQISLNDTTRESTRVNTTTSRQIFTTKQISPNDTTSESPTAKTTTDRHIFTTTQKLFYNATNESSRAMTTTGRQILTTTQASFYNTSSSSSRTQFTTGSLISTATQKSLNDTSTQSSRAHTTTKSLIATKTDRSPNDTSSDSQGTNITTGSIVSMTTQSSIQNASSALSISHTTTRRPVLTEAQKPIDGIPDVAVEQLVLVAGHKATIEITIEDVSLPIIVRLLYYNGSSKHEIGSSAIMNSVKWPGGCMMWKYLDKNHEWFLLQRLYCKHLRYDRIANAITVKLSFTTYPVSAKYSGNFTFRVGTRRRALNAYDKAKTMIKSDDEIKRLYCKEISIVARDALETSEVLRVQNFEANYPFTFDLRPSNVWVRLGSSAEIILIMSNFELPVYLLHKPKADGSFSHFYTINTTETSCIGSFQSSVLFASAHIKACTETGADGQYSVTVLLKTLGITLRRADQSFLAASYRNTINEANRRLMELAKTSLTITTYTHSCRADNDSLSSDVFAERFGSSVSVSCKASCLQPESAIIIGLERYVPDITGRIRVICDNGEAILQAGPPGKVIPDCALAQNFSLNAKLVAKFEIPDFRPDLEGQYHCFVENQGFVSWYPVTIYLQRNPTLTITGTVNNEFESFAKFTNLMCHATNGQPPAHLVWLLDDEVVEWNASYVSSPLGNSSSLLRLPMNHAYNGKAVRCRTVPYGSQRPVTSSSIGINFYHLPLDVDDQIINSNSTVNVTCNVFKSNPPLTSKNCSMSTYDGQETREYTPSPDEPIVVGPGYSLKVRCICQFKYKGISAVPQTMIYVNWKGALNLVTEVKVMRYITAYVASSIGGLALLVMAILLLLRQRGFSLRGPPLPEFILSQLATGEAVIEKTASTAGYTQILIKQRRSGVRNSDGASRAGPASLNNRQALRRLQGSGDRTTTASAAAAGRTALSMAGTARLVSCGTMTSDRELPRNLRRTDSKASSTGNGKRAGEKQRASVQNRRSSATSELTFAETGEDSIIVEETESLVLQTKALSKGKNSFAIAGASSR